MKSILLVTDLKEAYKCTDPPKPLADRLCSGEPPGVDKDEHASKPVIFSHANLCQ